MSRLNTVSLASAAVHQRGVSVANYDRATITPGIVHLGIGAFHRAHMAAYVDDLLAHNPTWGIIGASLPPADIARSVRFLIESPAITGTTLLVDGGQHLQSQPRDVMFIANPNKET